MKVAALADALKTIRESRVGVAVYASVRPLTHLETRVGDVDVTPHPDGSWVLFYDLRPDANFGHPCRYVLADPDGGVREVDSDWFPTTWREEFERIL